MKFQRIFLLVLDSLGVGEAADAISYGDQGVSTLGHVQEQCDLFVPNLKKLGFLDTIHMSENNNVEAYYTIARPKNLGKDSLAGHYEMMGIPTIYRLQTYADGIPRPLIDLIEQRTGRRVIGNVCGDVDEIIQEYGEMQMNYGSLIVFSSGDATLEVAAHEDIIPVARLYQYCELIRGLTENTPLKIGRVVARPFTGRPGKFHKVNSERKDYAIKPPKKSVLDQLKENNYSVITIGKVNDIFDNQGITKTIKAGTNKEALNKLNDIMGKSFTGLCFLNLAEFDANYGHKRDVKGYANAIEEFDVEIPMILNKLELTDLLIITADHGCDPTMKGTAHTRENVPLLFYSRSFIEPKRLEISETLADIGATIADNFQIAPPEIGTSLLEQLK